MGRKQDQAVSAKMTKTDCGKPMEQEHVRQQQHKSRGIEKMKRGHLKPKAGFTLYSEPSNATKSTRSKNQKTLVSTQKLPKDKEEVEEQFLHQAEVVSQMQIQNELVRAAEIVIPAVDFAIRGDNSWCGNFDHPEFGTPFNKRLVSSTPDPEHLLEAELLEHPGYQSSMMCPQMIPERDTAHSIKSQAVVATVASSLSEKLKAQRQKFLENQQFLQHQQNLQQYQQPLPSDHLYGSTSEYHFLSNAPNNEVLTVTSSPVTISKAEWVVDVSGHQYLTKNETTSTLVHSIKGPKEDPSPLHTSSSVNHKYDAPPSETAANSDNVGDDFSAETTKGSQPHMLVSNLGGVIHPFQASEMMQSNLKPSLSQPDKESGSAFPKPDMSTRTSYLKSSTRGKTFPDPSTNSVENALPTQTVIAESSRKVISHKHTVQDNVRPALFQEMKKNISKVREKDEDSSKENTDSSVKSKLCHRETKREHLGAPQLKSNLLKANNHPPNEELDTSGDTCDMEVSNAFYEQKSNNNMDVRKADSVLDEEINCKQGEVPVRVTPGSDTTNLSQVIEILKSDVFNKAKENEVEDGTVSNVCTLNIDGTDTGVSTTVLYIDKKQSGDNETLVELMRQYLPEADKSNVINNSNEYIDMNNKIEDANDVNKDLGVDINQNQNEDHDYEMQTTRRSTNLQYLERMADPTLRDIVCRLTLKATALRDVELRDLIDDMIFHTDAALGHEDAQSQSNQLYLVEENRKLKKRIQTINQQLDAKERQERLGIDALDLKSNDVLHLERKMMYLRQEKDILDNQVTTLLEEKAKWLITQQDLVRTISLKNHDILKIEEKYHEEKKMLLKSLDQATKNSQGVHYKLSVADREISNLEQCIKSRNLEIVSLKDKLKETEGKLIECERRSLLKDQEMQRLQDLVDTLKIGVDHVLQAYESSSKDTITANQRQGMENLRQMVHPEKYSSTVTDPGIELQSQHRTVSFRGPHQLQQQTFSSSQRSRLSTEETRKKELFVRPIYHYTLSPRHQRQQSTEETRVFPHSQRSSRRDKEQDMPSRRLTSKALEEHNRRLSPFDRTLWRSLENERKLPPVFGEDPCYSDSEIEINGYRRGRRSSHRYRSSAADNLQRHFSVPCSNLSPRPGRTEHPNACDDDSHWNDKRKSQSTEYSTLRSVTIPKSVASAEVSIEELSDETYFSTLRSKPLSDEEPRSLSVSHPFTRYSHKHNRSERNVPHHSLHDAYGQLIESSASEHQSNLHGQDVHFTTLEPEHSTSDTRGISHDHLVSFPHANFEAETGQDLDRHTPLHHHYRRQEKPHISILESSQEQQRSVNSGALQHPSFSTFPTSSSPTLLTDISVSRRATRDTENLTQREFFQGTELSASLSTISEANFSSNDNQLKSLNENPFSSGIASLDEKIANLQRKIDRTKAMYS